MTEPLTLRYSWPPGLFQRMNRCVASLHANRRVALAAVLIPGLATLVLLGGLIFLAARLTAAEALAVGFAIGAVSTFAATRAGLGRFLGLLDQAYQGAGPFGVTLTGDGGCMRSAFGETRHAWGALLGIRRAGRATILVFAGYNGIAIPDSALPEGMTAAAFGKTLEALKEGSADGQ